MVVRGAMGLEFVNQAPSASFWVLTLGSLFRASIRVINGWDIFDLGRLRFTYTIPGVAIRLHVFLSTLL